MKKLIALLGGLFLVVGIGVSQNQDYSDEDYQRYYEAKLKVDFRNYMLRALELESEEIEAIDPLMRTYMNERIKLAEQKLDLVADYEEEMQEDDSRADEIEETSDFIENYWEASIEEMQLKKRYFDLFEGRIPYQKALEFFMLEDELQYQIARPTLLRVAPVLMKMQDITQADSQGMSYNYRVPEITLVTPVQAEETSNQTMKSTEKIWSKEKTESTKADQKWEAKQNHKSTSWKDKKSTAVTALYKWVNQTEKKVDLDHAYTRNALYHITTAFRSMDEDNYFSVDNLEAQLTKIESIADKLQDNWKSTMHADWARKAFIKVSDLLKTSNFDGDATVSDDMVAKVATAARSLKKDRLMTDQATEIYQFVDLVAETMKTIEKNAWSTSSSEEMSDDRDK